LYLKLTMKFIVAFLAALAVGYVSATVFPDMDSVVIDLNNSIDQIFPAVDNITSIVEANAAAFTPTDVTQLTSEWNSINTEIGKLPDLCDLAEGGLITTLVNSVFGIFGILPPNIGENVSNIIGFAKSAIQIIVARLTAYADVINTAFNVILWFSQALVTASMAGVTLVTGGTVDLDVTSFQLGLTTIFQTIQTNIDSRLVQLIDGPLGTVFDPVFTEIQTVSDKHLKELFCLVGKITGVPALANIEIQLTRIQTALALIGIEDPF